MNSRSSSHQARTGPCHRFATMLVATASFLLPWCACGQGTLLFDTDVLGLVDTRMTLGSELLDSRYGAQLFTPSPGNTLPLIPLLPLTTFKDGPDAGYVNPVLVTVPNAPAGSSANIIIGVSPAGLPNVLCGNFGPFSFTLGSDTQPGYMTGMPPFLMIVGDSCIPELPPVLLSLAAAGLLLVWRRWTATVESVRNGAARVVRLRAAVRPRRLPPHPARP
jgi:hypothetical protein